MSTQPPPTPTQPGEVCCQRRVAQDCARAPHPPAPLLATVSSRPGCSDSPALLWGLPCSRPLQAEPSWGPRPALPASHPQASGSPFRVCAVWPWARFPFGWDAQNQTWCLFFCHVSCAIRLFLLLYFSVPASLCRLWINLGRGKTLVTSLSASRRESSGRWTLLLLTACGRLLQPCPCFPEGVRWSPVTLSRPLSRPRGWTHADWLPGGHSGLLSLP